MLSKELQQKLQKLTKLTQAYQKLNKKDQTINQLHQQLVKQLTELNDTPLDDDPNTDCTSQWKKIVQYCTKYSNYYPHFSEISGQHTPEQEQYVSSKIQDWYEMQIVARAFPYFTKGNNCYYQLPSNKEKHQYNYVVKRTTFLQSYAKQQITKQAEAAGVDPTFVTNILAYYEEIEEAYNSAPSSVQQIKDKAALVNSSKEDLATIHQLLTNQNNRLIIAVAVVTAQSGVRNQEQYKKALTLIPESTVARYATSFDAVAFWVTENNTIEEWQNQASVSTTLSEPLSKWLELYTPLKKELQARDFQKAMKDYAAAVPPLQAIAKQYPAFKNAYQSLGMDKITADQLKGSRYESVFTEMMEVYNKADETIATCQQELTVYQQLLPILPKIEAYKIEEREASTSFNATYKLGNPVKEDQTKVEQVLKTINSLQQSLAMVKDWKTYLTNMASIDLVAEKKKWEDRLVEVKQLVTQRKIWTDKTTTLPNVEGLCLPPQTFANEQGVLAKTKKVKIGMADSNDGTNLTAPDDVDQGNLGDCYFLASLASMAQTPNFFYGKDDSVIQIIHPDFKKGKKAGQLDPRKIEYFSVQMYLPITSDQQDKNTGRTPVKVLVKPTKALIGKSALEYAQKADSGELWVAIVEKAFAEIRGGYQNIEGGFPEEGFALLLNKTADDFTNINLQYKSQLNDLQEKYKVKTTQEAVQKFLQEAIQHKKHVTLSTRSIVEIWGAGGIKLEKTSPNGDKAAYIGTDPNKRIIYGGHSYSVQGIHGDQIRLLNPHGTKGKTHSIETEFNLSIEEAMKYFDDLAIV